MDIEKELEKIRESEDKTPEMDDSKQEIYKMYKNNHQENKINFKALSTVTIAIVLLCIMIPIIAYNITSEDKNIIYDDNYQYTYSNDLVSLSSNVQANEKLQRKMLSSKENDYFKILLVISINKEKNQDVFNNEYNAMTLSSLYSEKKTKQEEYRSSTSSEKHEEISNEIMLIQTNINTLERYFSDQVLEEELNWAKSNNASDIEKVYDYYSSSAYTMVVDKEFILKLNDRNNYYQVCLAPKEDIVIEEPKIEAYYGEYICISSNPIPTPSAILDGDIGTILTIDESMEDYYFVMPSIENYLCFDKYTLSFFLDDIEEITSSNYFAFKKDLDNNTSISIIITENNDIYKYESKGIWSSLLKYQKIDA